jgi:hypothetical protein
MESRTVGLEERLSVCSVVDISAIVAANVDLFILAEVHILTF